MPIFDLHRHFEGAHPIAAVAAAARAGGVAELATDEAARAACVLGAAALLGLPNDAERRAIFARTNAAARRVYSSPEVLQALSRETCVAAAREAPGGFELRFSLFSLVRAYLAGRPDRPLEALTTDEVVSLARALVLALIAGARESGTPVRLRFGLSRNLDPTLADKLVAVSQLAADPDIAPSLCGLDVLGIAARGYAEPYPELLLQLLAQLRRVLPDVVIHAGEFFDGDPEAPRASLRQALALEPNGIGHGVWAASDPELLRACAESGATFEICPQSNRLLNHDGMRLLASVSGVHPLLRLLQAGVRCVVCSDDPTFQGTTLADDRAFAQGLGVVLEAVDAQAARRFAALPRPPWDKATAG